MSNKHTSNPYESPATGAPLNDDWAARREAAEAVRQLIGQLVTTTSDAATLRAVAANIQQQTELLAQATTLHGKFAFANHGDGRHGTQSRLANELSPIGGKSNPISPPFKTWIEGDVAHGRTTLGWQYEGPPNTVHGGFVCALFDQFLGVAQYMTGNYGFTGTLSVRFKRPTPLCTELQLIGRVKEVSGRKISVVGEIWANGVMTASCECLFIQVDWGQLEKLHAGG